MTSPLSKTSLRVINPCEDYGELRKHRKYDVSFEGTDYTFCAMVFETLGAINGEGEEGGRVSGRGGTGARCP